MKAINENYYIQEDGTVFSVKRHGTRGGKLKQFVGGTGYAVVSLSPSKKPAKVHRLVADAFLPNPNSLPQVNHKDGNKLNNHKDNLEWCTSKENCVHAMRTGLLRPCRGEDQGTSILTEDAVKYIRSVYKPYSKEFGTRALAKAFNVHWTNISRAISFRQWSHVK